MAEKGKQLWTKLPDEIHCDLKFKPLIVFTVKIECPWKDRKFNGSLQQLLCVGRAGRWLGGPGGGGGGGWEERVRAELAVSQPPSTDAPTPFLNLNP